jgi:hypothetical protein
MVLTIRSTLHSTLASAWLGLAIGTMTHRIKLAQYREPNFSRVIISEGLNSVYRYVWLYIVLLLYVNFIFVVRHPDDGHRGDRNILVKSNSM